MFRLFCFTNMRVLRVVIVVLVLIIFPLVSWIYLSKGLKWRLGAQEETAVKATLDAFTLTTEDGETLAEADLTGQFQVIAMVPDTASARRLGEIQEQFGVRPDYATFSLQSEQIPQMPLDSAIISVQCMSGCEGLFALLFEEDHTAAIVDDSLRVRGRYVLSKPDDVNELIKHLAVVLPISKRDRIELKRRDYEK